MLRHWVNRVGEDGVGLSYSGDSAVISPKGDVLVACEPFADEVKQVDIDLKALREFRVKFPCWRIGMNLQLKINNNS